MVFMGSKKYPGENEYDAYISSHGGSCNACTEGEFTTYQFCVKSENLEKSLDIFANCFSSPLFASGSVERELKAIESEFSLAKNNDSNRASQLLSSKSREGHVNRIFGWGNIKSLKTVPEKHGVDILHLLRQFHSTHYLPEAMKLVVMSPVGSLNDLRTLVVKTFGSCFELRCGLTDFPSRSHSLLPSEKIPTSPLPSLAQILHCSQGSPLPETALAILTRIVPIRSVHRVHLIFQLPPTEHLYKMKTETYLAHLIGHEGAGSVLSALKSLGLATSLSAGVNPSQSDNNSIYSFFGISVYLTERGLANWIYVVKLVYLYIDLLKREGPQEWIFRELQQVAQIDYDHLDDEEEEDFVERLSVDMRPSLGVDRRDLLTASSLFWEWDAEAVSRMLAELIPSKAVYHLSSSTYQKGKSGFTFNIYWILN